MVPMWFSNLIRKLIMFFFWSESEIHVGFFVFLCVFWLIKPLTHLLECDIPILQIMYLMRWHLERIIMNIFRTLVPMKCYQFSFLMIQVSIFFSRKRSHFSVKVLNKWILFESNCISFVLFIACKALEGVFSTTYMSKYNSTDWYN